MAGRLLAVHAHADDETITMGGTMAALAARGVSVQVLCCTDGELATIVAADMPEEEFRPRLAAVRRAELAAACGELGILPPRFLGYHDSGMAGSETALRPEAFFMQSLDEAGARVCAVIREFRPHVIVTYDSWGAYGHPDHIQAHRATLLAFEAAGRRQVWAETGEPWRPDKLYYTAMPASGVRRGIELARAAGMPDPFDGRAPEELDFVVDDSVVTTAVPVGEHLGRKRRALLLHHSQIDESFPLVAVPEEMLGEVFPTESYQLAISRVATTLPESDLFAGVDTSR